MTPKILVVEDDKFLRKAYSDILKKEGFDVKIAVNGREGLELVQAWQPHLVLLDMLMPEMDGLAFLKAFDAPAHPETKIIVFSNLSMPEKVSEAIALGAVNPKTKAMFTPNEMIELIRSTIGDAANDPATTAEVAPAAPATDPSADTPEETTQP